MSKPIAVVVLAAGKGTRMKSTLPKVMHPIANRSMLLHVLDAAQHLKPEHTVVITGHKADAVEDMIAKDYPKTLCVRQEEQLGTGHAVMQAAEHLKDFDGNVLILCGDVPLVEMGALDEMIDVQTKLENDLCVASAIVEKPFGLGRIIRNEDKTFAAIREHKDCSPQELDIKEVNVGIYLADCKALFKLLPMVDNNNAQSEYYLPDILPLGIKEGLKVAAHDFMQNPAELTGVNDRVQLATAEKCMQERYRKKHMEKGASLQDPATAYFSYDTKIGEDVTIGANVVFGPNVTVGNNVTILPFSHLKDCEIKDNSSVKPENNQLEIK